MPSSRLVAGGGILDAGDVPTFRKHVQAPLIARDAAANVLRTAFDQLAHGLRVRDVLPGHGDHVGLAASDDFVGLRRVVDAPHSEHGERADRFFDSSGEREPEGSRMLPVGHVLIGDEVRRALDHEIVQRAGRHQAPRDLLSIRELDPARAEVVAVDLHADDVVGSYALTHRAHDAERQAASPLEVTAVLVHAVVHIWREERGQEIAAVGGVDLDAIHARLVNEPGGPRMRLDDLVEIFGLHRLWHLTVHRARDSGRRHQCLHRVGAVRLSTGVTELRDDWGSVLMHSVGNRSETRDDPRVIPRYLLRVVDARGMDGRKTHHDQADPTTSTIAVIRDVLISRLVKRGHIGDVGGHHHPVAERQVLERKRRQERLVRVRHRAPRPLSRCSAVAPVDPRSATRTSSPLLRIVLSVVASVVSST